MDGKTGVNTRTDLIKEYQSNDEIFLFLLTTKTGGIGINLTSADRIILYDPDWNPTTDIQARERSWRIGQLKSVTIYRLITSGSIEEKIYQRQIYKQFLSNKILKDPRQKRLFHSHILHDLFTLEDPDDDHQTTETVHLFSNSRVYLPSNEDDSEPSKKPNKKAFPRGFTNPPSPEPYSLRSPTKNIDEVIQEFQRVEEEKSKNGNLIASVLAATGVRNILSHDSIIEQSGQEEILIAQEAEKIAERAASTLQKSVEQCLANSFTVPTWTGSSGSSGAPGRFGKVTNSKIQATAKLTPIKQSNINNFENNASLVTWGSSIYK